MALFAVLMCVNFTACSSDDDPTEEKEEGGVVVSGKKLVKMVTESEDWKETRIYNYDNKGRLTQATETDEYNNEKETRTYQFIWGDDAIKVSGADSYILTLKNGLIQSSDTGETFVYNNSNRLLRVEDRTDTTIAIWDDDKLMFIYSPEEGWDNTLTYGNTCKKGYIPLIVCWIDANFDEILFEAHPEIVGMRTTQLPATVTKEYINRKINITYEFDKEGYISKIISKLTDGSIETCAITWQ